MQAIREFLFSTDFLVFDNDFPIFCSIFYVQTYRKIHNFLFSVLVSSFLFGAHCHAMPEHD